MTVMTINKGMGMVAKISSPSSSSSPYVWAGMQGSPFQRALPAGELSADSRGSAPPGASARSSGKMLPASPSESATASFDGRRLSKVLLRLLSQKVTKAAADAAQGKDVI